MSDPVSPASASPALAALHSEVADLLRSAVAPPGGLAQIEALDKRAALLGGRWEHVALQILLARFHTQDAQGLGPAHSLKLVQAALPQARELQDTSLTARLLSSVGSLLHTQRKYAEALEVFKDCILVLNDVQDSHVRFLVLNNTATFHMSNANYAEAQELLAAARAAANESGDSLAVGITLINEMSVHNSLQAFAEVLRRAAEIGRLTSLPMQFQLIKDLHELTALNGLGRERETLHRGEETARLAAEFGNPALLAEAWAAQAQAYLQLGQPELALPLAQAAQTEFEQFGEQENLLDNELRLSRIYEVLGEPALALKWARRHHADETGRLLDLVNSRSSTFAVHARLQALEAQTAVERQKNEELSQLIGTLEETRDALEFQLTHDTLTGLHNRLAFQREVQTVVSGLEEGEMAALIFMDLDNFKGVNDLYGHAAGDDLLTQASRRLLDAHPGLLAGRIGGDEFVLLRRVTGEQEAHAFACRLLEVLGEPFLLSTGDQVEISSSAGVALAPRDGLDAEGLQQKADQAMYASKRISRGLVRLYSEDIGHEREEKVRLENDLRRAVREGELVLYYQGRFDVLNGELRGLEALVRWARPGAGLVGPHAFIPVAEQSQLMLSIGEWVLCEACQQAVDWNFEGRGLNMAVNVSIMQFQQPDFVQTVRRILDETHCPAQVLTLELTETMILRDVRRARLTIAELQALGLRVAMDDFGTGYSSLGVLRTLPLDNLKIDRAFMEGITLPWPEGGKAQVMLATIIDLAHQLGMHVTAEGVETQEQLAFLRQTGCDYLQGFLLGRPEPAEKVVPRLSDA